MVQGRANNTNNALSLSYKDHNGLDIVVHGIAVQLQSDAVPEWSDAKKAIFDFEVPLLPAETRELSVKGPNNPDLPNLFFVEIEVLDVLDHEFNPRVRGLFHRTFGKLPPADQLHDSDRKICPSL